MWPGATGERGYGLGVSCGRQGQRRKSGERRTLQFNHEVSQARPVGGANMLAAEGAFKAR